MHSNTDRFEDSKFFVKLRNPFGANLHNWNEPFEVYLNFETFDTDE